MSKQQPQRQSLTETERLARDLYIRLTETPGVTGRQPRQIAVMAFDRAEAFFEELESRKQ